VALRDSGALLAVTVDDDATAQRPSASWERLSFNPFQSPGKPSGKGIKAPLLDNLAGDDFL
jgi:hypothetical protein